MIKVKQLTEKILFGGKKDLHQGGVAFVNKRR